MYLLSRKMTFYRTFNRKVDHMISKLFFTAKFNKEIPDDIPSTPGGFTFTRDIGGNDAFELEEITFDFMYSSTNVDGNKRHFECWELDTGSFPASEYITPEIFNSMLEFTDIFVDLDEADDDTKVIAIENMEVVFDEANETVITVSKALLDKYNQKYLGV